MPKKKKGANLTYRKKSSSHQAGQYTRPIQNVPVDDEVSPAGEAPNEPEGRFDNISNAGTSTNNAQGSSCLSVETDKSHTAVNPDKATVLEADNISSAGTSTNNAQGSSCLSVETDKSHTAVNPDKATILEALSLFQLVLPDYWKVIQGREGFHIVGVSKGTENISVQREVFVTYSGVVKVFVHRKLISQEFYEEAVKDMPEAVPLLTSTTKTFVDKISKLVLYLRKFEICAGVDQIQLKPLWKMDPTGYVDTNPYAETRYVESFRTHTCCLLVPVAKWRCHECSKAVDRLKCRFKNHQTDEFNLNTRNSFLDENQMRAKLKEQRKELKSARLKIDYLTKKVASLIEREGVPLDKETSDSFNEILSDSKLTPLQQLFIQQQVKSSTVKGATGMRWHPTIIRFALLIKSTSSAAYAAMANSGCIRLPSERTLFDYEHALPRREGVFHEKVTSLGEKVKKFEKEHQQYHSLLCDEIHICQKLVYRKSDGSLVGYVKLNEVEVEMQNLADSVNGAKEASQPSVATKILAFMVKGCTNNVKEVVAAYPTASLSKEELFDRSWEVIRACEGAGIKILAFISDGSSVNRAFIKMHTPASPCASNVVFDTLNLCALDRKLYFIADPPHLIKTIRNCFAKSGTNEHCTRLLKKNGEYIEWNTIVKLYDEDVSSNLRKSYKLNALNVHLNSFSVMKVSFAAQVLSKTVALDLQSRKWPGTAETVDFILRVNDFFDNLNGAHTSVATKKANPRLAPYRNVNDERFDELLGFEQYLLDWDKEVQNLPGVSEEDKPKMTLSNQTVEGVYMAVNGFCGAVRFLLNVGADFVNGRVFCQDPLEQYFGKQRASGGSRNNPTVASFMTSETRISIHRDVNVRKRSGNCETFLSAMEISNEPIPRKRRRSF